MKKYYTMNEVTTLLGISKNTLINWEKEGKIPQARRQEISKYRIWTEEEFEDIKKIRNIVMGNSPQPYRGMKIYTFARKESRWNYRFIFFECGKIQNRIKAFCSTTDYASREKALEEAKKSIDGKLYRLQRREAR